MKNRLYRTFIKRLLDIVCSLLAIVVFSWLYAIIAIMVRIKLGTPVIFKQSRPGMIDKKTGKEKIFCLYKFRTMTNEVGDDGKPLPDDIRLTKFGRFLRSTSLDELPEAINILKGDMSIIGPRPLLVEYLPYYTQEERKRHNVRPGLSGLAQVNGRNATSWEDKFKYDLQYVEKYSFALDVRIILNTVVKTIRRSDILVGSEISAGRLDVARKEKNNV